MPYLASVLFFFVSIVLLHLHIGTCFIVLVFSLSFLLVRDTALVMCIIFRSPQWCWRCRCPKKIKIKNHYVINQSVIPQSTNGESTKKCFFSYQCLEKLLSTLSRFCGLREIVSEKWRVFVGSHRWQGDAALFSLKGNSVRGDIFTHRLLL